MNILRNMVIAAAGLILASSANATIIWDFNLPATAISSQSPPYPSLGTLTIEDLLGGGVKFTLDPDESNPGYYKTQGQTVNVSHIIGLDFVFAGLGTPTLGSVTGPTISDFDYITANNNMDSGYTAADDYISMKWNKSASDRFLVDEISMWNVMGVTEADFANTFATSGPKPSPITAILSVSAFAHPDNTPNPSNWVAGTGTTTNVPEPGILGLLGAGLLGLQLFRRKPSA